MKKLLIGCGVVALLLVGGVSFVAWKLWPAVSEFVGAMDSFVVSMQDLNDDYPYDADVQVTFEPERFAEALELRGAVRRELAAVRDGVEALEDEDLGRFEMAAAVFRRLREPFEQVVLLLDQAQMSPAEFAHHMLTYWSAARSAHDGLGDQAKLGDLRDQYERLAEAHERARDETPDLPRLNKLLEPVSPAQTEGARAYLEEHRDLGELSDVDLMVEMMLIRLGHPDPELVQEFGMVNVTVSPARRDTLPTDAGEPDEDP